MDRTVSDVDMFGFFVILMILVGVLLGAIICKWSIESHPNYFSPEDNRINKISSNDHDFTIIILKNRDYLYKNQTFINMVMQVENNRMLSRSDPQNDYL